MNTNNTSKTMGNVGAERSVLALWLTGQEMNEKPPSPKLFWNPANKEIAMAITAMHGNSGISTMSVHDWIQRNVPNPVCNITAVGDLASATLSFATYTTDLALLYELSARREVLGVTEAISSRALSEESIRDLICWGTQIFEEIGNNIHGKSTKGGDIISAAELQGVDTLRENPDEIFKARYLCRGSALLLISNTGQGKSTLIYQGAFSWALGLEAFGLIPAGPLTTLIIQAENDQDELAEMIQGATVGEFACQLTTAQIQEAGSRVLFRTETSAVGSDFFRRVRKTLASLQKGGTRIDLLVIDPVLSYLGGDPSKADVVSPWLRQGLQQVMEEYNLATILIAHTAKPQIKRNGSFGSPVDDYYAALGSVEWVNYARASLLLKPMGGGMFELRAGKRGARLKWRDREGRPAYVKRIAHANDGGMYWRIPSDEEFEVAVSSTTGRRRDPSIDEFIKIFAQTYEGTDGKASTLSANEMKVEFAVNGWIKDNYAGIRDRAVALGYIKQVPGYGGSTKRYAIKAIADRITKEQDERLKQEAEERKALKQKRLRGISDED